VKKKGKRTAILSNGSPSMLDSIVRHAGLEKLFDHVLSVEEVGIYKPSRRVYRLAMQKLHDPGCALGLLRLRQHLGCTGGSAVRFSGGPHCPHAPD
jgi:beta-phosphoglucomutase-like phosphatase (HAD superfamily)